VCVLEVGTPPPILQARTRRATEPSLSDAEGELGILPPAASVAIVEQDHLERNFSTVGYDSSSSESYSGRKEESDGDGWLA
jgi:hypothetical protein